MDAAAHYFLAVLPTIPDSDVTVIASDTLGHVVDSQQFPRALITSPRTPAKP